MSRVRNTLYLIYRKIKKVSEWNSLTLIFFGLSFLPKIEARILCFIT